jgi:FkbM family methyltransferase
LDLFVFVPQTMLLFLIFSRLLVMATGEIFSPMYQRAMGRLSHLMDLSIIPPIRSIVDVGANTGDWSVMINSYFPNAQIFMIEGNPLLFRHLNKTGFPFTFSLIGDSPRPVKFHTHRTFHTGGSIFREKGYDTQDQTRITVMERSLERLDDVLVEKGIKEVDFLKMDIQGAEFLALQGAIKTLEKVTYLTLEVSIHQYNPGAAQFTDIDLFLQKCGFRLYDIIDLRHAPTYEPQIHSLVQADFIWAKANSAVFTSAIYPAPPNSVYTSHLRRIESMKGKQQQKRKRGKKGNGR